MAKSNYQVPGSTITIEKGTSIIIPVLGIHNDPEYFPEPQKFDPNRFSNDEKQKRDAMTWLAFGDGPRNCIGNRFGMMQTRIGLITLLNNFEFSATPNTEIPIKINLKSSILMAANGVYLQVKQLTD